VQEAYDQLLDRCRQQRAEWLTMTRIRLGLLLALAGDPNRLRPLLRDEGQLDVLRRLQTELDPKLRVAVEPTTSARVLSRALRELGESLERFNRRWQDYLQAVDLTAVNELRDGYNRYYLLEKECLVRSPRVAGQGFRRLAPVTVDDLAALFPTLPVPQ
jgi:hypothetical protein